MNRFSFDTDYWCRKCKAVVGDGHDCDNCAFCGTDGSTDELEQED